MKYLGRRFLDLVDAEFLRGGFAGGFDGVADFLIQQRLREGGGVTDDAASRIAVPSAENVIGLRLVGPEVGHGDGRADADDVGLGVGEVGRMGMREEDFQFGPAAHEKLLRASPISLLFCGIFFCMMSSNSARRLL